MNNATVVNNIKRWLADQQHPQSWLADQMGVSKPMMSQMLSGGRKIQTKHLLKIAKITGLSLAQLADKGDQPTQGELTYHLRGSLSSQRSKQRFDRLLWDVKRYVDLKEANMGDSKS